MSHKFFYLVRPTRLHPLRTVRHPRLIVQLLQHTVQQGMWAVNVSSVHVTVTNTAESPPYRVILPPPVPMRLNIIIAVTGSSHTFRLDLPQIFQIFSVSYSHFLYSYLSELWIAPHTVRQMLHRHLQVQVTALPLLSTGKWRMMLCSDCNMDSTGAHYLYMNQ